MPVHTANRDLDGGRLRVLRRVRKRLGHHVVGGRLDLPGQPLGRDVPVDLDLDLQRGARDQRVECRRQPSVGEDRRVDATRQLAQLGERLGKLLGGCIEQLLGRGGLRADAGARKPQRQRQRHEPLLGPVMEVALEAAALGVGGLDDAGALRPDPGLLRLALGDVEAARDDQVDAAGLIAQGRVAPQDQAPLAAAGHPQVLVVGRERLGPEGGSDAVALLWRDEQLPDRAAAHLGGGVARELLARLVELQDPAVGVEHDDEARHRADDRVGEVTLALEIVDVGGSSAWSRSLARARPAAALTASSSPGSSSSAGSWTSAATRRPSSSISVTARPPPGAGSATLAPAWSTQPPAAASQ